jgi:hypothetical protein
MSIIASMGILHHFQNASRRIQHPLQTVPPSYEDLLDQQSRANRTRFLWRQQMVKRSQHSLDS